MLNYLKKFAMDILPSVAATIIGAYIVNHYITAKPADAPVAAAVSSADPKKTESGEAKPSEAKPSETPSEVAIRRTGRGHRQIHHRQTSGREAGRQADGDRERSGGRYPSQAASAA